MSFSYTGHFFCNTSHDKIKLFIHPDLDQRNKNVETLGLIDSGAGGEFIDQNYVKSARSEERRVGKEC